MSETLIISNLQSNDWHSNRHYRERQIMLHRLTLLMEQKSYVSLPKGRLVQQLGDIAGRLEFILYSRAASFDEYNNVRTLRRRLRYLICSIFRQAEHESPRIIERFTLKRKTSPEMGLPQEKKTCFSMDFHSKSSHYLSLKKKYSTGNNNFLFGNQVDLIRCVYGYLSGRETYRHFAVNRSSRQILPKCVTSLWLDLKTFDHLHSTQNYFFQQFPHLEELSISRAVVPLDPSSSSYSCDCVQLEMSSRNNGELSVRNLSSMMIRGDLRHLKRLGLISLFANTSYVDGVRHLCMALSHGACSKLEYLGLGGNSFGDSGAMQISLALRSGKIPHLQHLDIRRNFIGEQGIDSLANSIGLGYCPELRVIRAGGNILDNRCASLLAKALDRGKCTTLTTLGLEDNFIETSGLLMIAETYTNMSCPFLKQISFSGNSIEGDLKSILSRSKK